MELEEWRPTHHEYYEVSNLGRVRSWRNNRYGRGTTFRILRPAPDAGGYPTVMFGRHNHQVVHRLVAAAFISPCPEGQECRHKDDDRANARWDNLEYGTRQENVDDMMTRGRYWSERRVAYLGKPHRKAVNASI